MHHSRLRFGLCFVLGGAAFAHAAFAEEPQMGPVIKNYGPVFAVPESRFALDQQAGRKVVFDVAQSPEDSAALNRRLESVARYLNMHARAGIDTDRFDIAVVLHGKASWNALSDVAYRQRFDGDNPNTGLITALKAAGVDFWLCGQSAGFNGIASSELSGHVNLALSAMTVLQDLQAKGYALLP